MAMRWPSAAHRPERCTRFAADKTYSKTDTKTHPSEKP
jgi:hypothetical protein